MPSRLGERDHVLDDSTIILSAIRQAWIETRFSIPSIAVRAFGIPRTDTHEDRQQKWRRNDGHYLTYEVPRGAGDVERWADETYRMSSRSADPGRSLREFETELTGNFWEPEDGRHVFELHVSKGTTEYEWNVWYVPRLMCR